MRVADLGGLANSISYTLPCKKFCTTRVASKNQLQGMANAKKLVQIRSLAFIHKFVYA